MRKQLRAIIRTTKRFQKDLAVVLKNRWMRPNLYRLSSNERIGAVYYNPTDMCVTDRIMIYALVRGLRPEHVLEIGVRWGGAARIIANALEDTGRGYAIGIDPETKAFRVSPSDLHNRYRLIEGSSPEDVPAAVELLGGVVNFVFIDALHTHDAVRSDFEAVRPFLADDAHVLFHDNYHQGICLAVDSILDEHPEFSDCGILTRSPAVEIPVSGQGLRLIRKGVVDGVSLIKEGYERSGIRVPPFTPALRNWDAWGNRVGKGATPEELLEYNRLVAEQDARESDKGTSA